MGVIQYKIAKRGHWVQRGKMRAGRMLARGVHRFPGAGAWKILDLIGLKYIISFPFLLKK